VAGVAAWATAIPTWRLDRALLGRAWDSPAAAGERSVAGADQDSLTLAADAALAAVRDPEAIEAIFFATTTAPYAEKHAAATIAAVLGRAEVRTLDVTGTLRAGTAALRAALDAVRLGSVRAALVVAADVRPAEPASVSEQRFGDGAAAVVVTADGAAAEVVGEASVADDAPGRWRRARDAHVRSFDARFEAEHGYAEPMERTCGDALKAAGVPPDAVSWFAAHAPDPRAYAGVARRIGLGAMSDPLLAGAGDLGAAHALASLAAALDQARPGDHVLLAAAGEGADAVVLTASPELEQARAGRDTVARQLSNRRTLPSYERYLRFRRLVPVEERDVPASTIRSWRDRAQALGLRGVRCTACGTVQFPANRACVACGALDRMETLALGRHGRVFTFTLDHLIAGEYLETPIPRAVVDLDGGGRLFLEVTDCEPSEVRVGMPVELTFRLMHEGAGFKSYYWKARPERGAA
jgi:3-hydroxy-3-methylglutaryl CoA synthase